MRPGLALPLALAALIGVLLARLTPPGLVECVAAALLMALALRWWRAVMVVTVMAGVAVALLLARGADLAPGLAGDDLDLEVTVLSVSTEARLTRLTVAVERCEARISPRPSCDSLRRVRLTAYGAPVIQSGERWAFTVRLRPPSGFANPHTFDYRAWLWREGIQASGYVRDNPPSRRLAAAEPSLRQRALAHLDAQSVSPGARRWLAALTVGASERLTPDDWELLNASGTTHLMVISGLHVGLVAAFALALARGGARLVTPGGWRLAVWPWWLAGAAAAGYAGLAGLEPPALRALIMTLVGLWVASGRHAPGPWQAWWLAMALVLMVDPHAAWRPGFWLSFTAVALLLLIWQGRTRPRGLRGWCWALLRTQLLLAPLMAAAVLLAFGRLAPAAPLVNLLAVPLVSTLLVPLGLLGWLLAWWPSLSWLCWWMFARLGDGLVSVLAWAVDWLPLWHPAPFQRVPLALSLVALALLWALPGLHRALRLAGSLALVLVPVSLESTVLPSGQLRFRVHDVGQGQLIELRTASYRALYDTGPRYASGFTPLASLWPPGQRFDDVIVSHDDLDHAGGVAALDSSHNVVRYLAPPGGVLGIDSTTCRAGETWQRDGVTFRLLWPPARVDDLDDNDRSCVLEVTADAQRLLITGDLGREAERTLLLSVGAPVTVLVAGHHGSDGSSGPQWVGALSPAHVVFSAGKGNPFGHPADDVVRRFRQAGSCQWSTARDGALTGWLGGEGAVRLETERPLSWRHSAVGGGCLAVESCP